MTIFPVQLDEAVELGAVDDRSVRAWVRLPGAPRARAVLEVQGRAPVAAEAPLGDGRDWTGVVVASLDEPAPGRPFRCHVAGRTLAGRLTPSPGARAAVTFAVGSCHQPFARRRDGRLVLAPTARIYDAMAAELAAEGAELLLLLGDQVYADALGVRVDALGGGDWLAGYRLLYRGYLGERGLRRLREQVPTLCMWDDNDIANNWGTEGDDRARFAAAARAFCEYQRARNPVDPAPVPPPYDVSHVVGDVGFHLLDLRGERDAQAGRLLGEGQRERLLRFLARPELATVFVGTSVPLCHGARWFVQLLERLPLGDASSLRDRWTSRAFMADRDWLLATLFSWLEGGAERQAFLLAGDVHAASVHEVRAGGLVLHELTASALTTRPTWKERVFNRVATRAPGLGEAFAIRRRGLTLQQNYALVEVRPRGAGGHDVTVRVRAWDGARLATAIEVRTPG